MIRRIIIIFFCLLSYVLPSSAKSTVTVEGAYTFYAPSTMSMAEAEQEAIRRAQFDALQRQFGLVVVENTTSVSTEDDEHFYQEGNTHLKGEWIETIGTPEIKKGIYEDGFYVSCKIKGKAREIETSRTDIDVKILCNRPDTGYEHTSFKDGDKLYLSFKSADNGYISIYLYDKDSDKVSCLLPYISDTHSVNKIEKDKEYLFFSKEKNPFHVRALEYKMRCTDDISVNTVYVLFSKNEFSKPALTTGTSRKSLPSLSYDRFHKWLTKCLSEDDAFQVIKRNIEISKN